MRVIKGDNNLTRAQSARVAKHIWRLLDEDRVTSPIKTTLDIETTMKKAQNFNPDGCVCIFFARNGVCAVQGVGAISVPLGVLALQSLEKYTYKDGEVKGE